MTIELEPSPVEHEPEAFANGRKLVRRMLWPVVGLLIFIMISTFGLVVVTILSAAPADIAKISATIAEGNAIGRVVALVIIAPILGGLAIVDRGNGSAVIAALSAIAGYVLGGVAPK